MTRKMRSNPRRMDPLLLLLLPNAGQDPRDGTRRTRSFPSLPLSLPLPLETRPTEQATVAGQPDQRLRAEATTRTLLSLPSRKLEEKCRRWRLSMTRTELAHVYAFTSICQP